MNGVNGSSGRPSVGLNSSPLVQNQTEVKAEKGNLLVRKLVASIKGVAGKQKGNFQPLTASTSDTPIPLTFTPESYMVTLEPPTDAKGKQKLAMDARLAAYPYHRSLDGVNKVTDDSISRGTWELAKPLATDAGKAAQLSVKGSKGFVYDKKTGLTAYVFYKGVPKGSSARPEVRIVFGGTTSGKKTGGLVKRLLLNRTFSLKQWIANGKNALLGKIPDSYKQAEAFTKKVQDLISKDEKYEGAELSVSGHSKGGGEAAFAAISLNKDSLNAGANTKPIQAICFSSTELGSNIHDNFSEWQKDNASRHVTHYHIEGDAVPNASKVFGGLGHLGKVITVPSDSKISGPLDRHGQFNRHINHYAKSEFSSYESVRNSLVQNYGEIIAGKVLPKRVGRPLKARKVKKLQKTAARLKSSIDKQNHKHVGKWGDISNPQSLASKLFEKHNGFPSQQLPDYERSRLEQHIEQAFFQYGDHKIATDEAGWVIEGVFAMHQSGFAEVAAETVKLLGVERPFSTHLEAWENNPNLSAKSRSLLQAFCYNSSQSARLKWQSPFNQLDKEGWSEQIENTNNHIGRLKRDVEVLEPGGAQDLGNMRQALALDIYQQISHAEKHVSYLLALGDLDFRTPDRLKEAKERNFDTALKVIDGAQTKGLEPEKYDRLEALKKELKAEKVQLREGTSNAPPHMKAAIKIHAKKLRGRMVAAGLKPKNIKQAWKHSGAEVSNSRQWNTIEKVIPVRTSSGAHIYKGTLTPAAQMRMTSSGDTQKGPRDPFTISYEGKGRCSTGSSEAEHVINLYSSSLTGEGGSKLYSGLRSGTLAPVKANEEVDSKTIAKNRAKELLQAAFVEKYNQLTREEQDKVIDGEPLTFDMVSSSMLSPDSVRHKTGIHDDELSFQTLQREALQELCQSPSQKLEVYDDSGWPSNVNVNIRLATLNIPVNSLGLNPLQSTLGQTWKEADKENDAGLKVLLGNTHPDSDIGGMVGDWLRRNESGPKTEKEKVFQLAGQIRNIYTERRHHSEGADAYKLVERVQLLAFMIGAVPHMNCKSGKDRTGEADARTRQLAAEVDQLGYVPDPDAPLTRDHQEAVQTFLFGAGNLEVQQQNINVPAYKTMMGRAEAGDALFGILH